MKHYSIWCIRRDFTAYYTYIPVYFIRSKSRYRIDILRYGGIIAQFMILRSKNIKDQCIRLYNTINKSIPTFIKYGVRLY